MPANAGHARLVFDLFSDVMDSHFLKPPPRCFFLEVGLVLSSAEPDDRKVASASIPLSLFQEIIFLTVSGDLPCSAKLRKMRCFAMFLRILRKTKQRRAISNRAKTI